VNTESPSPSVLRRAWSRRGFDDGLKDRASGVAAARARGGEPAAAAYLAGYRRGQRSLADSQLEP
jgi:hypothetical protein